MQSQSYWWYSIKFSLLKKEKDVVVSSLFSLRFPSKKKTSFSPQIIPNVSSQRKVSLLQLLLH